ncbi:MAG: DNA-binding protein [Propionibacteriaceae bacterium]|jgi:hypothetical protein|nr:DNA-binding protein [Propionibacteriaceae bacterium]
MAFRNPFKRVLGKRDAQPLNVSGRERNSDDQAALNPKNASLEIAPISTLKLREKVRVKGTIAELTVRERNGTPWLEAKLKDISGSVTLVWMGRYEIPGVLTGGQLVAEGRLTDIDGVQRIYNPYYELIS